MILCLFWVRTAFPDQRGKDSTRPKITRASLCLRCRLLLFWHQQTCCAILSLQSTLRKRKRKYTPTKETMCMYVLPKYLLLSNSNWNRSNFFRLPYQSYSPISPLFDPQGSFVFFICFWASLSHDREGAAPKTLQRNRLFWTIFYFLTCFSFKW